MPIAWRDQIQVHIRRKACELEPWHVLIGWKVPIEMG